MKTDYRIKNFRAFGEDGANIHLAPLTILTGCNSSGKSSIAKSILLLDTFLSKIKRAINDKAPIDFENNILDFSEYPLNLLGRFNKVLNASSENGEMEFKYSSENGLEVILTFITKKEDVLNRGYLKKLSIYKDDNEVFVSSKGYCSINMIPFFDSYIKSTKSDLEPSMSPTGDFMGFHSDDYQHTHKVSNQSILWASKNNSLFNIPILKNIGSLNRDNFVEQSQKLFSKLYKDVPGLNKLFKRIAEVYTESEYETFIEFFNARAKEWLSNISNESDIDLNDTRFAYPKDWSHANSNIKVSEKSWFNILKKLNDDDERMCDRLKASNIKFPLLLNTLVNIGNIKGECIDPVFGERISVPEFDEWFSENVFITKHYLWEDFKDFVEKQLSSALSPDWSGKLFYVGSSRIEVKRLYTLDSKTDFSFLLKRYFKAII